jgi:hypothetical protein
MKFGDKKSKVQGKVGKKSDRVGSGYIPSFKNKFIGVDGLCV